MRFIGMLLALGAITWVLYQATGGGEADSVISEGHQKSLEKAKNLEKTLQIQSQKRLDDIDNSIDNE